jgi:hypothetical protein
MILTVVYQLQRLSNVESDVGMIMYIYGCHQE